MSLIGHLSSWTEKFFDHFIDVHRCNNLWEEGRVTCNVAMPYMTAVCTVCSRGP